MSHLHQPPFEKIVELYHEILPNLRPVEKLTKARKTKIRERWGIELKTLDRWREYFTAVRGRGFLMGKNEPQPPRTRRFQADFDFLITEKAVVGLAEGKYDDEEPYRGRVLN